MIELNATRIADSLNKFKRVPFLTWETPLERLPRLSNTLGIELSVKRDDLTGLAFGGNKVRSLEYYFGKALDANADTILITGAVQSNYVRVAAACAARLGMACHIQLEERVSNVDTVYRSSGNVLLDELLGATLHFYPVGDDEEGADQQLGEIAAQLVKKGRRPFIIPLGANSPPFGSLGYVRCAAELLKQATFDYVLLASGSGQTHAGLLFGLRAHGWSGKVIGICVRRPTELQTKRIAEHCDKISTLLNLPNPVQASDIELHDDVLAPGYGMMNDSVATAIRQSALLDALLVDPVYTGRAMAGLIKLAGANRFIEGKKEVVFLHTGGLPALFGYESELRGKILCKS